MSIKKDKSKVKSGLGEEKSEKEKVGRGGKGRDGGTERLESSRQGKAEGKRMLKKINIWVISSRWGQGLPKGLRLAAPTHHAP